LNKFVRFSGIAGILPASYASRMLAIPECSKIKEQVIIYHETHKIHEKIRKFT